MNVYMVKKTGRDSSFPQMSEKQNKTKHWIILAKIQDFQRASETKA